MVEALGWAVIFTLVLFAVGLVGALPYWWHGLWRRRK